MASLGGQGVLDRIEYPQRCWRTRSSFIAWESPPQGFPIEFGTRLQSALGDAYRVQRELGGGGMSRVFLAEETRFGRQVVIKVLPAEMDDIV